MLRVTAVIPAAMPIGLSAVRCAITLAIAFASIVWPTDAPAQQIAAGTHALSLRDVLEQVPERNREVQAARRAVEAARADVVTAGARPNPTLTMGMMSISPQAGIGAGGPRDKTVDSFIRLDQLIERGGKRELRIETARNVETAAGADVLAVIRSQRLLAAAAYFDIVLAQQRVQVTQDNVALFDRTLQAAELRLKAGDIAASDVARLRVDALRAQNDLMQAEADRRRAQLVLGYLIGIEAEAPLIRAVDAWPAAEELGTVNLDVIVDQRPEVRAAQARLEAAQANRELARRLRTRDVTVGAQFDRYPTSEANPQGTGNTFGFAVQLPLFWRYRFEGEIARAEADWGAAGDALERTRILSRSEVVRAQTDLAVASERVARYDRSLLVEARRSAEFAEFAYRNGALGVMDLLDARRILLATQLEATQARAEYARARAAWDAAITTVVPVQKR